VTRNIQEMFKNSTDELFGPLKVPRLIDIGRSDIQEFLYRVRAYRQHQDTRRNAGEDVETLELKFLVEPALLRTLAIYEMGLKDIEELESERLEVYLTRCLQPSESYVPSLSKLFDRLKLETSGGARQRVINLFKAVDEIVLVNGLSEIDEKEIVKQVVKAIEPRRLREMVQDDILLRGKSNYATRADLFQLIMKHVEGAVCYEGKMESSSKHQKDGGNRQEGKSKGTMRCYNCRGNHRARDCKSFGYSGKNLNYISPVKAKQKTEGEGISNRMNNRGVDANSRGNKSRYSLRENPRPSTRLTESREARLDGGSSGQFSRPTDKAGGQAKQVKLQKVHESSGWATLQKQFKIPYRLDRGQRTTNNRTVTITTTTAVI